MVSPQYETPGGTQQSFIRLTPLLHIPYTHIHIYHFERKVTPFVYLLLTNSNPFHLLILELGIPLTAVIA